MYAIICYRTHVLYIFSYPCTVHDWIQHTVYGSMMGVSDCVQRGHARTQHTDKTTLMHSLCIRHLPQTKAHTTFDCPE